MEKIIAIAIGGGLGALSRFATVSYLQNNFTSLTLPVGTLGVNLVGSFLIGFFSGAINRFVFASPWPEFLLIGFLGSYTTFSTFSLESLNLMRDSEFFWLAANLVLQVAGGILFALVGLWLFARLLDS